MKFTQFPRTGRVRLDKETHTYTYNNTKTKYISVSKVLNLFFTPFDAKKIANNIKRNSKNRRYYNMNVIQIYDELKKKGKNSSELGSDLHEFIEFYYKNKNEINYRKENKNEVKTFLKLVERFKKEGYTCVGVEIKMVWNKFAGTADALFEKDGKYYLIDWKRAKDFFRWINYIKNFAKYPFNKMLDFGFHRYCVQINFYAQMLKHYGIDIAGMYIIRFYEDNKNNEPEIYEVNNIGHLIDIAMKKVQLCKNKNEKEKFCLI